ncbi:hypothetical protein D3C75_704470 [compost metagenome]
MWNRVDTTRHIQTRRVHARPARHRFFTHHCGVTHIADLVDFLTHRQAMSDFHQRTLAVAENQHVGFSIHQNRTTNGIRPVIVMRGTAQARFDAAEDHRHITPGFFTALGVGQGCAIRAFTRHVIRRIRIVVTQFTIRGIAVDHRIHVACGHTEEQIRFAKTHEVFFSIPVWLGNDTHAEALGFQHTATDRHTKTRMVDVGISGNQNDVTAVPA